MALINLDDKLKSIPEDDKQEIINYVKELNSKIKSLEEDVQELEEFIDASHS